MTAFHHCCFTWREASLLTYQLAPGQRLRIKLGFLLYLKSLKNYGNCIALHQKISIPLVSFSALCSSSCAWTGKQRSNGKKLKYLDLNRAVKRSAVVQHPDQLTLQKHFNCGLGAEQGLLDRVIWFQVSSLPSPFPRKGKNLSPFSLDKSKEHAAGRVNQCRWIDCRWI